MSSRERKATFGLIENDGGANVEGLKTVKLKRAKKRRVIDKIE